MIGAHKRYGRDQRTSDGNAEYRIKRVRESYSFRQSLRPPHTPHALAQLSTSINSINHHHPGHIQQHDANNGSYSASNTHQAESYLGMFATRNGSKHHARYASDRQPSPPRWNYVQQFRDLLQEHTPELFQRTDKLSRRVFAAPISWTGMPMTHSTTLPRLIAWASPPRHAQGA